MDYILLIIKMLNLKEITFGDFVLSTYYQRLRLRKKSYKDDE